MDARDESGSASLSRLEPGAAARKYTTISIPTQLYRRVEEIIDAQGFRSATEYIVHVTRVALDRDVNR